MNQQAINEGVRMLDELICNASQNSESAEGANGEQILARGENEGAVVHDEFVCDNSAKPQKNGQDLEFGKQRKEDLG